MPPPSPRTLRLVCLSTDNALEAALQDELAAFGKRVSLTVADPRSAGDALAGADGVLCGALPPELKAFAPALRWVQFWSTGVDGKLHPGLFENGIQVTNGSGIDAASCADHVLALVLAFARGLPLAFRAQEACDWSQRRAIGDAIIELENKTVGIVGAGAIGQAIGSRCQAFGMRTVGTRRDPSRPTPGMNVLLSHLQYHDLLLESDFIVLSLPLTPSTRMIFGEDEIEIVRRSAHVFNIGRGGLIDERWLVRALENRWIAGAGLDVFDDEPLPPDSPFWRLPNCIVTPHVGGAGQRDWPRFARLVAAQAERLLNGKPLENRVDKDLGY